jgi:hypothetical protein
LKIYKRSTNFTYTYFRVRAQIRRNGHNVQPNWPGVRLMITKVQCISISMKTILAILCSKCGKLWTSCWKLQRHKRTCEANVRYSFLGGVCHPSQCIFEKIEEFDSTWYPRRPQVLPIQGNVRHRSHAGTYI